MAEAALNPPRDPTAARRATTLKGRALVGELAWLVAPVSDGTTTSAYAPKADTATPTASATRRAATLVDPEARCPCVVNCTFSSVENQIHGPL